MPENKTFIDTNIIIYAYDISAGKKHDIAKEIIISLWRNKLGVISTQVLQEFFVIATGKIANPLEVQTAKDIINDFLSWTVVANDTSSILETIDIHKRYKYSFWDSLVIQSALSGGATVLLSEDCSDGQRIESLSIKNPFN